MTPKEIKDRSEQIAIMLGSEKKNDGQFDYWTYDHLNYDPMKILGSRWISGNFEFHSDWNWIMEAVEFIKRTVKSSYHTKNAKINELFIDEWEFGVKKYYIRLIQWTEDGWRMFDDKNRDLSILYIVGENCSNEKDAVFLVVSDFAKLYNNKEL